MEKFLHISFIKLYCQVQIFLGLCLAMLFICSSHKTFAYGEDGFPATPTPVPSYLSYQVDVLSYDGYSHTTMLDYPMQQISNTSNVSFYSTYLRSCLETAIDNYNLYFNTNINPDLSSLLSSLEQAYPFDPHNPFVCINFLSDSQYLYIIPDFHIFHFDADPTYNRLQSGYFYNLRIVPSYIYFSVPNSIEYFVPFLTKTDDNGSYLNLQFSFSNWATLNNYFGATSNFNGFESLELPYQNNSKLVYRFNYSTNSMASSIEGFYNNNQNLVPLVIMNPIYTMNDYYDLSSNSELYPSFQVSGRSFYLRFVDITSEQLEDLSTMYQEPYYWVQRNFSGLTYTFEYVPVPVTPIPTPTPIPTFGIIYTPTPFPTNIFSPVVTPIDLPVNPVIQIGEYGSPWDFIAGIGPLLTSALNSGTVRFFVSTIEYIYNSSLFFEVIMLLVPSICLIAFILGRLRRK